MSASTGLTEQDIWDAANRVDAKGLNPTLQRVREELGRGSFSTISAAMRTWSTQKAEQSAVTADPAPEDVRDQALEGCEAIWKIAVAHAQQRHDAECERWQGELAARERALEEANEAGDSALADAEAKQTAIEELESRLAEMARQLEAQEKRAQDAQRQHDTQADRQTQEIEQLQRDAREARRVMSDAERAQARAEAAKEALENSLADAERRYEQAQREWNAKADTLQRELYTTQAEAKSNGKEIERLRPQADQAAALERETVRLTERLETTQALCERYRKSGGEAHKELSECQQRAVKAESALEAYQKSNVAQRPASNKPASKTQPTGKAQGNKSAS